MSRKDKLANLVAFTILFLVLTLIFSLIINKISDSQDDKIVKDSEKTLEPIDKPTETIPEKTSAGNPTPEIIYITATPEIPEITPEVIYVIVTPEATATPKPTPEVIYVIVTPEVTNTPIPTPKPTPEVIYVTPEPTIQPTPVPTAEPTVQSTPVPTAEPTVQPTPVPTAEPTVQPTPVPTAEPTVQPTPVPTAEPTIQPTLEPVYTPTPEEEAKANLVILESEVKKLCSNRTEFLISKGDSFTYDLSKVVNLNCLPTTETYELLSDLFSRVLAHRVKITDETGNSPSEKLRSALSSAICPDCGRVILVYAGSEESTAIINNIVSAVDNEEQKSDMNKIFLDFLNNNTIQASYNCNERLLLICAEHK